MLSRPDFMYKQVICVFTNQGEKFSFRNDNLVIKDKEGKIKHQSTCHRLFVLFIVGYASITSGLLQKAKRFHFSIILSGNNFRIYSSWNTQTEGNVLLREKQYKYNSASLAQQIVDNKLLTQFQTLSKIRNKNDKTKDCIDRIKNYREKLEINSYDMDTLLGIEGQVAKAYFKVIFDKEGWQGRKPRTKIDTINTLLDIGYTLLFNFVEALLNLYGFDIYKGVYHQCFFQRKSLVCDLMEPMRPIIDYRIRNASRLNQINESDFFEKQNQYILVGKNALPYSTFLLEEIMQYKETLFLYIQKYYRSFIREKSIKDFPVFSLENKG